MKLGIFAKQFTAFLAGFISFTLSEDETIAELSTKLEGEKPLQETFNAKIDAAIAEKMEGVNANLLEATNKLTAALANLENFKSENADLTAKLKKTSEENIALQNSNSDLKKTSDNHIQQMEKFEKNVKSATKSATPPNGSKY